MSVERERVETFGKLENGLRAGGRLVPLGPVPERAPVGHGARGLQRGRHGLGVPAARPRPLARLPLGRGRARRLLATSSSGSASALALWNGRDPILKERIFGLTGNQGNHGEDAKEYWWYLDALPSHAWNRWRYHYPQARVPVRRPRRRERAPRQARPRVRAARHRRLRRRPLLDRRGRLREGRPARPADDRSASRTPGPDADTLHVLPTAWYRNTWAWEVDAEKPELRAGGAARVVTEHPFLGQLELVADPDRASRRSSSATTRRTRSGCSASPSASPTPKDGINDHVVAGADTVDAGRGHEGRVLVPRHASSRARRSTLRVRLRPAGARRRSVGRLRRGRRRRAAPRPTSSTPS